MDEWEWVSPRGVTHLVGGSGRCATCGRHHERCAHCREGIVRERRAWATSDPRRDGPWYCRQAPDRRHEPEVR